MLNVNSRIIFWYYFPETVNMLKYESSCKTIFLEFLAKEAMNSPYQCQSEYMDIRVHGIINCSMLVYFINVFSRDRNKTKSLSFRTKNIFGKYFTKYRKCLRIYRIYKI